MRFRPDILRFSVLPSPFYPSLEVDAEPFIGNQAKYFPPNFRASTSLRTTDSSSSRHLPEHLIVKQAQALREYVGPSFVARAATNWQLDHHVRFPSPVVRDWNLELNVLTNKLLTQCLESENQESFDAIDKLSALKEIYSAKLLYRMLDGVSRSEIIDADLLTKYSAMLFSGSFDEPTLYEIIQLTGTHTFTRAELEYRLDVFYSAAEEFMGILPTLAPDVRAPFDAIQKHSTLGFKTKYEILRLLFKRVRGGESAKRISELSNAIVNHSNALFSSDFPYYRGRLRFSDYGAAEFLRDVRFWGMFKTDLDQREIGVTNRFSFNFTQREFTMRSRFSQNRFVIAMNKLPQRERMALFVLEEAFGDTESLQLTRRVFGNNSFNHENLSDEDKRIYIHEILGSVADYLGHMNFDNLESLRKNDVLARWFDLSYRYRIRGFKANKLAKANRNNNHQAIPQQGFVKEFREEVWAHLHLEEFQTALGDKDLREIYGRFVSVDADGLFVNPTSGAERSFYEIKTLQGDSEEPLAEHKSLRMPESDVQSDKQNMSPSIPKLLFQFHRTAIFMQKKHGRSTGLHLRLITDLGSIRRTRNGSARVSDAERVETIKNILIEFLKTQGWSVEAIASVMVRVDISFAPYHKVETHQKTGNDQF